MSCGSSRSIVLSRKRKCLASKDVLLTFERLKDCCLATMVANLEGAIRVEVNSVLLELDLYHQVIAQR